MSTERSILFVLTSANAYSDGSPTGWFLPEAAHPYYELLGKAKITWASPKGGKAPLDPSSVEMFKEDPLSQRFLKDEHVMHAIDNTLVLSKLHAKDYDAIFYVGGAGPCLDLVDDPDSVRLIEDFYNSGRPTTAVCHAPAVFRDAKDKRTGKHILEGREATAFSNAEEDQTGKGQLIPTANLPEHALKASGAIYKKAAQPWGECVCVSADENGILITGQNPASAAGVGKAIIKVLNIQ